MCEPTTTTIVDGVTFERQRGGMVLTCIFAGESLVNFANCSRMPCCIWGRTLRMLCLYKLSSGKIGVSNACPMQFAGSILYMCEPYSQKLASFSKNVRTFSDVPTLVTQIPFARVTQFIGLRVNLAYLCCESGHWDTARKGNQVGAKSPCFLSQTVTHQ